MGNSGYIKSAKAKIDFDKLFPLLEEINEKYFGTNLIISKDTKHMVYTIQYPYIDDWVDIWQDTPRCLRILWPSHYYLTYICIVFKEIIAERLNCSISDESDPKEINRPNSNKYYPIQKWIDIRFSHIKDEKIKNNLIEDWKSFIPIGMEKY